MYEAINIYTFNDLYAFKYFHSSESGCCKCDIITVLMWNASDVIVNAKYVLLLLLV